MFLYADNECVCISGGIRSSLYTYRSSLFISAFEYFVIHCWLPNSSQTMLSFAEQVTVSAFSCSPVSCVLPPACVDLQSESSFLLWHHCTEAQNFKLCQHLALLIFFHAFIHFLNSSSSLNFLISDQSLSWGFGCKTLGGRHRTTGHTHYQKHTLSHTPRDQLRVTNQPVAYAFGLFGGNQSSNHANSSPVISRYYVIIVN